MLLVLQLCHLEPAAGLGSELVQTADAAAVHESLKVQTCVIVRHGGKLWCSMLWQAVVPGRAMAPHTKSRENDPDDDALQLGVFMHIA